MANYGRAIIPDSPFAQNRKKSSEQLELQRLIEQIMAPKAPVRSPSSPIMGLGSERGNFVGDSFSGAGGSSRFPLPATKNPEGPSFKTNLPARKPIAREDALKSIPLVGQILSGAMGAANGGITGALADSVQTPYGGVGYSQPSFDEVLAQIQSSMQGAGQVPDASQMAQEQFAPQFDLLAQLRSQTTGRMNQQAEDAQAMYDSLASSIEQDKSQATAQYDTAAQNIDAAFSGASDAIQQTGDSTNAEMNAILNRLGIGAARPETMARVAEDQNRSANAVAELQANYAGNNEANRQSMLDYLTNSANTAGVAGANARADVELALADALAGYDNQQLALTGQQKAAENEYAMQLAGMQANQQESAMEQAWRQYESMLDQSRWEQEQGWRQQTDTWDNEIARANAERAMRELEIESQRQADGSGGRDNMDASTALLTEAAKYYPQEQANAVAQQIRTALQMAPPEVDTIGEFLRFVQARFPGNNRPDLYSHLANLYAQRVGFEG